MSYNAANWEKFLTDTFPDFGEGTARWVDRVAILKLDDDRRAKVEIIETGRGGDFEAISVKIVNKNTGPIDSRLFRFGEHIGQGFKIKCVSEHVSWWKGCEPFDMVGSIEDVVEALACDVGEYIEEWL